MKKYHCLSRSCVVKYLSSTHAKYIELKEIHSKAQETVTITKKHMEGLLHNWLIKKGTPKPDLPYEGLGLECPDCGKYLKWDDVDTKKKLLEEL